MTIANNLAALARSVLPSGSLPIAALIGALPAVGRSRIINGAMRISQERGTATLDVTTGAAYVIDQWRLSLSSSPGGTLRGQQVALATPGGSPFRLRATVQAADASIAAGDAYVISHFIEGQNIADARFGAAGAHTCLVRLGVRSSIAGTFGVSLTNSASNRSWVGLITIAAGEINTDVVRTLAVPGDVTGTWLTDAGVGMQLRICLSAGTTFQGAAGWQAGNITTTAGQTNFMGTGSATFDLFDAALYVDALGTGVVPLREDQALDDDLRACRRFWRWAPMNVRFQAGAAAQSAASTVAFETEMRVVPAAGTAVVDPDASFSGIVNATVAAPILSRLGCGFQITSAASGDSYVLGYRVPLNSRL